MDIKFSPEFLGGKLCKVANGEFKGFTSEDLTKIKNELLRIFEGTYQAIFDIMKNFSNQPWNEIERGISEVLKQRNILVADSIKNLDELNEFIKGLEKTLKDMVKVVEEEEDITKAREAIPVPVVAPKAAVKRTAIEEGSHFQEGDRVKDLHGREGTIVGGGWSTIDVKWDDGGVENVRHTWDLTPIDEHGFTPQEREIIDTASKEVKAVAEIWWNRSTPDQRSALLKSMGYSAEAQKFWKDTEWKELDEELQDELRDEEVPVEDSVELKDFIHKMRNPEVFEVGQQVSWESEGTKFTGKVFDNKDKSLLGVELPSGAKVHVGRDVVVKSMRVNKNGYFQGAQVENPSGKESDMRSVLYIRDMNSGRVYNNIKSIEKVLLDPNYGEYMVYFSDSAELLSDLSGKEVMVGGKLIKVANRNNSVSRVASIEDFKEGDEVIDVKTGRPGKVFIVNKLVGKIGVIINGKEKYFAPSELAIQLTLEDLKEGPEDPFR